MESKPLVCSILASGNGSNAESLIRFSRQRPDLFEVRKVITDNADAGIVQRCHELAIDCQIIPYDKLPHGNKADNRRNHEEKILNSVKKNNIEWLLLAGYMRILTPDFINYFNDSSLNINRIINIHPSLLPSFPGKNAYQQAYESGVKVSGVTLHFVDSGIDTGPPILQDCFSREDEDTLDNFIEKGLELEYSLYKKGIEIIAKNQFEVRLIEHSDKKFVYLKKG